MGFDAQPWLAAPDVTEPDTEANYELAFLPHADAFYSFAGYLCSLPGREGPPGADFNTWPSLKPLGLQLLSGYWRPGNRGDFERMVPLMRSVRDPAVAVRVQGTEFGATLKRLGL